MEGRTSPLSIGSGAVEKKNKSLLEDASVKSEELFTTDSEEQNEVELNEEERKLRFEKLTRLLSKSKAYTNYLQLKLSKAKEDEENAAKRKKKAIKPKEILDKTVTQENKTPKKRVLQEQNAGSPITCDEVEFKKRRLLVNLQRLPNDENEVIVSAAVGSDLPSLFSNGTLRPYQVEGFQWLKALYENGVNGILADEMGLGKTVQVIALLCHLYGAGCGGPYLIICPLSTLCNWSREIQRFAPQLPVVVYYGSEEKRTSLRTDIRRKYWVAGRMCYPMVVTSYQVPLTDTKFLSGFRWKYIIVDEAQRMKNHKCKFVRSLSQMRCDNRLLLTGTPLQNNLAELWSLLHFLMPELFNDSELFELLFDMRELQNDSNNEKIVEQEKSQHILSTLHDILAPFMLRRIKADVALELPPKKEVLVYAPMTEIQYKLYRATLEYNIRILRRKEEVASGVDLPDGIRSRRKCRKNINYANFFSKSSQEDVDSETSEDSNLSSASSLRDDEVRVSVGDYYVNLKMQKPTGQLHKIVNHPYLVHFPVVPGTKQPLIDEAVISSSGKFQVLDVMLKKLKEKGHKVLLFSTFVMVLDLIEELLDLRNFTYCRLDGGKTMSKREDSIARFNEDPDTFVFLISTRAGGLGLNLTSADTVIIFDSDWNPQVDLQAQDRCHRIGQTRPVMVYRLITRGTIDQRIVETATAKRKLEKMVIQNGKFKMNSFGTDYDPNELMELLNSKYHDFEVDSQSFGAFTDEELDLLLNRSISTPERQTLRRKLRSSKFQVIGDCSNASTL